MIRRALLFRRWRDSLPAGLDMLMDAANKPDRGPVQPGWASTDLRPDPPAPISAPIPDHPGGGKRREWAAVPARPPAPLRPGASGRGGAGRSRPTSRRTLALASPRRIRDVRGEAAYHGDEAAAGGAVGGADDDPEGQTLAVGRSRPLSSCCWSSPGPPAGSGPPARRPRRRRNSAAVNSPGEWVRRSLR